MRPQAVIFDFDDTLVYTNAVYDQLRQVLFAEMDRLGLGFREEWADYLNQADLDNIAAAGRLSCECFPLAMRATGEHFAARSQVRLADGAGDRFEEIGWRIYQIKPRLMEGAAELLDRLQGRFPLHLLTVADSHTQQPRIEASGLMPYFDKISIVQEKTPDLFRFILAEQGWQAERVWMVGNSMRSDVNPALAAGLNVAFLTVSAWAYDDAQPVGHFHTIDRLADFMELIEL